MTFPSEDIENKRYKKHNYHGLTWYTSSGAQEIIFSMTGADDTPIKKLVADGKQKDGSSKDVHLFSTIATQRLPILIAKNCCIQEINLVGRKTKPVFDIDGVGDNKPALQEVAAQTREVFPDGVLRVCGYETLEKHSYHIVVSNYAFTTNEASLLELKKIVMSFPNALGFDPSIYTKHRPMKCVNQSKPKKPAGLPMLRDKDTSKHLI